MTCTNIGEEPVLRDNRSQEEPEHMRVIITRPPGAGKTSTMWRLGEILASRHISHAVIDVDAAMAENFRASGARCLIFADVVEHPELAIGYGEAIPGADVHVVRLDVPMERLLARLEARESTETIEWYRNRARELQGIMADRRIGDLVIDVGARTADEVATEIASHRGYGPVPG